VAGLLGLGDTGFSEVYVSPTGEPVFQIPGGFAVANENKFVHGEGSIVAKTGLAGGRVKARILKCDSRTK
jgi:hypothetical protein